MFLLILFLMSIFITLGIGALAALSDVRTLTIPNMHSIIIVAVFFIAYGAIYLGGGSALVSSVFGPISLHLFSAVVTFAVTAIMFAAKAIGAGDSKFATACALWVNMRELAVFLFFMTVIGAILGIIAIYIRRKKPFKAVVAGGWIDQVQNGASKVPYGVAIFLGMLIAFLYSGYFSSETMELFMRKIGS